MFKRSGLLMLGTLKLTSQVSNMIRIKDFYNILGIPKNASKKQIKKSY